MHIFLRSAFAFLALAHAVPVHADQSNVAVFHGPELLKQCSRQSLLPADAYWTPTAQDIARLESSVQPEVAETFHSRKLDASKVLTSWARQYVGLIREGRRYLYGSFFPAETVRDFKSWRMKPLIICDGGPSIFGIEMNIQDGTISHLSFNGR